MAYSRYPKLRRDENGKFLCRGCGGLVPKGRQTWCSRKCYKEHEPAFVRRAVENRDKGVCCLCGLDTEYVRRAFARMLYRQKSLLLPNTHSTQPIETRGHIKAAARKAGWPMDSGRSWWEADHIVPFSEGGETVLENMQTLCLPCHKKKTAAMAKAKAEKRRLLAVPGNSQPDFIGQMF